MDTLRTTAVCLLALASLPAATAAPRTAEAASAPVRVLFVGNSFAYYHDMPAMLEALSAATGGPAIETEMVVEGGASLADHWAAGNATARIAEGRWDYVVLNSQSTFGRVFLVDGRYRVGSADGFLDFGRRFDERIREAGARTVLLEHWKDLDAPAADQEMIDYAYARLARETGALVAPAGSALQAWLRDHPSLALYEADSHHPSAAGSYLVAAVLYGTLLGRSAEGAPGSISGMGVDPDSGEPTGETVSLVDLPDEIAASIQRTAWRFAGDPGGFLDDVPARPPVISLPAVPRGRPAAAADLVGDWSGPLDLYPWRGILTLHVSLDGDRIVVRPRISFGGTPDDIEIAPRDVAFDGRRLTFTDPAGPNGSTVRYTGVPVAGGLAGIAELTAEGDILYGRGRWQLSRDR